METFRTKDGKDPELWEIAQKRVSFKSHLTVYVILNILFWLLWYFTGHKHSDSNGLPWPVWPTFGWGIGLFFHYMGAYINPKTYSIEREYQKLKSRQS